MGSEGGKNSGRANAPFPDDEDSFGDIWGQVDGPVEDEDSQGEAFTEFAASPGAYLRGASLRRQAEPPPEPEAEPEAEPDDALQALDLDAESEPEPGHDGTADDVRSLLDKVMEEALPTHPQASMPAFPEDGTPTLRPSDDLPRPRRGVQRDTATQLVDAEAAAMDHAVGATRRPPSFDALPSALSDEVKQAQRVVRGQPAKDLRHLTDDLAVDVAATSPRLPDPSVREALRAAPPPQPAPPRQPTAPPQSPPGLSEPELESEPALELAYDPRRARSVVAPTRDPSQLLDEVTPKSNGQVLIGLAIALVVLLLALVVKSLL